MGEITPAITVDIGRAMKRRSIAYGRIIHGGVIGSIITHHGAAEIMLETTDNHKT
jgi:hypothetical protein